MDLLSDLNKAVDYIENHLEEEIDFSVAAGIARCSEFHFRKMFYYLAGIPLNEYIRRRRLTLAALELTTKQTKIIDVALKFGYQSPDSFARAFYREHGFMPSGMRTGGHRLKAYSRIAFQLTLRGGSEINYRIVTGKPFRIAGLMRRVPLVFRGINPAIAAMWKSLDAETVAELKALSNVEPRGFLSASVNFSEGRMEENGELDHYIGVATDSAIPARLARLDVPAFTWAVFEAAGPFPDTVQQVWGRVYSEWFPSSNYEQENGPELLWNEGKDISKPDYRSEIWIPIRNRQPAYAP